MNGKTYHIERRLQESQAAKEGIDYDGDAPFQPEEKFRNRASGEEEQQSHEEWLKKDLFERISESQFRSRFK